MLGSGDGDGGDSDRAAPAPTAPRQAPAEPDERRDSGATVDAPDGRLVVGISDQKPDMFVDPRFRELGIRHVRLVVPWDAGLEGDPESARWLERARGHDVLVAFNHARGDQCPEHPCGAPAPERFERAFRAFRDRYPWVRSYSTWNEPNHASQPLANRPDLAARYHAAIRRNCAGCTVLAADIVADGSAARWVRASGLKGRRWGLHNYPDTNRFTSRNTRAFLRLTEGEVWITETGGIVEFTTASGRTSFPHDERRAARATRQAFELARSNRRIRRLYLYHWNSLDPPGRFDAGLIAADGRPRPAYEIVRRELTARP